MIEEGAQYSAGKRRCRQKRRKFQTERKRKQRQRKICQTLMGSLACLILFFSYAAGVKNRNLTVNGLGHILTETEEVSRTEVMPGEVLEKRLWIKVDKAQKNAKIKVRLLAYGIHAAQKEDLLAQTQTNAPWHYCEEDGYFYYQEPVQEGEKILFQAKIKIPEKWEKISENVKFRLDTVTETF